VTTSTAVSSTTRRVPARYIAALGFGQFGIFVALLTPIFISMSLKAEQIAPENPAAVVGTVLPVGAFGAVIANPLFGALSDRTRTRWGRRRPWLVGGVLGLFAGLLLMSAATDVATLVVSWLLCQVASNAATAALVASFADNVPEVQRARASSVLALAINLSILAGIYLAVPLAGNLPALFVGTGLFGVLAITVFALVTPDELPLTRPEPFSLKQFVLTFWTNPLKNPDFGLAWWSRFLITFASYMFTTFRALYMSDHLGVATADVPAIVAQGVLIYTIALLVGAAVSGWLSDRLGRRKIFVGGSTLVFGLGLVLLVGADTVTHFYLAEVVMGLAYGIYSAVDTALVVDVLPDAERPGKDLGVLNIANSAPQSLAPAAGLLLLSVGSENAQNYSLMLWGAGLVALVGALVVIPIRRVR
jgi:MFS family permease